MAAGDVIAAITSPKGLNGAIFDGIDDKLDGDKTTIDKIAETNILSVAFKGRIVDGAILGSWHALKKDLLLHYDGTNNKFSFYFDGGYRFSLNWVNDNKYHNFVLSLVTGNSNLWVDGILISTSTTAYANTLTPDANSYISFGEQQNNWWFNGQISQIRLWNRVLTSAEGLRLSAGASDVIDYFNYWKLESDYTDSKGNNDLANTGTRFGNVDEDLKAELEAARTTANDQYIMTASEGGQIVTATIEET